MPVTWPPTLAELKADMKIPADDTRDDDALTEQLAAAVVFVQAHRTRINYAGVLEPLPGWDYPAPDEGLHLGTLRLAARWHTRRNSPDALIAAGEFGSSRVPSFDPDIDRLLRIGRSGKPVFG